jgi:cysteine desulfurase / selenocysteine lyase
VIYLDHAATSFPKPPQVAEAIADFLAHGAGNPGRSGHALAVAAQGTVADTRRRLASIFGARDPSRIAFTLNATDALNMALWGLLRPGDRVVTTSLEHNAVARPLAALAERGVAVARVPCAPDGALDPDDLARALAAAPTRLVAMIHASNVCGTILPVRESARLAHDHGALFLLDAAQTAGILPIDVVEMGVDLLAFPGHKGLLGPTGTGGLYVSPEVRLSPMRQGGTGTRSEEERQPEGMPEALESGTVNTVGIVGLGAALRVLQARGLAEVQAHEEALATRLLAGLAEIPGVRVHGMTDPRRRVAVVSIHVEGWEPVDLGAALDSSFGIAVRPGLHCAPLAHRTMGTYPRGTVRLSPGLSTTGDEIDETLAALRELATAVA